MIARLIATIERVTEQTIIATPAGLGAISLELYLPRIACDELADRIGETIELSTLLTIESTAQGASLTPRLLAFTTTEQRELFELLTKVKGLGPRRALRAFAMPVHEIASAIARDDARALTKLPEIGKKLAEGIVVELRDKVAHLAADHAELDASHDRAGHPAPPASRFAPSASTRRPEHANRAIAALIKLGETPANAEALVDAALHDHPDHQTPDEVLAAAFARRG